MKKLKNKVFYVIFLILTLFLISILAIFNTQAYHQKTNEIKSSLMRMDSNKIKIPNRPNEDKFPNNNTSEKRIFMDSTIYTVNLDNNLNIIDVVNHTTSEISESKIKEIAQNILKSKNYEEIKAQNLYFDKYSYFLTRDRTALVILDNINVKQDLLELLKTSILIFAILEIIILIISKKLTDWIIKPVVETFDKQKQFIADASHELKTPLSVIIASSDALENEPNEKKWLANIKNEAERMNNLITDLLDMAKSENNSKEQYIIENLSKLVEKSVLTFEGIIYEKHINLEYNIEENIEMLCNKNQIKQLVEILLDNAVKHSSLKGEIKIDLKKEKGSIKLSVTNKGKDIPKEEQEKIFERFYRADEARNRNENRYGLGLAIAKNIVLNHNGEILVDSKNGFTTFSVILKQ